MKLQMPILPIQNTVFFPRTVIPILIIEEAYVKMIKDCVEKDSYVVVSAANELYHKVSFQPQSICGFGKPVIIDETSDGQLKIILKGVGRVRLSHVVQNLPYLIYEVTPFEDKLESLSLDEPLVENLNSLFCKWIDNNIINPEEREQFKQELKSTQHLVDYCSMFMLQDIEIKQILLSNDSLTERIQVLSLLFDECHIQHENIQAANAVKEYESIESTALFGN